MKLLLKDVRLAFPAIFEPRAFGDSEPAYSATFILPPERAKEVEDVIEAVAKEKWGAKADAILRQLVSQGKVCLHEGEEKAQYDGFEGNVFVNARSAVRPLVIDRDKTPLTMADGRIYAGCYVNASLDIWVQDNKYGKRINATLRGVQFCRDGEAFGGGTQASVDEFEDLGVSDLL